MPTPPTGSRPAPSVVTAGTPTVANAAGPAIADVVSGVLKVADTNGDGTISAAELSALQARTHVDASTFKADVAKIDVSGDGAISKAELTAYITKADTSGDGHISFAEGQALGALLGGPAGAGGAPTAADAAGPAIADVVTAIFKMLDANIDAVISASELTTFQTRAHVDTATFAADVAKVDANGDGAISKAELTSYLTKGDANGDGHISLAEAHALVPLIGAPGGPGDGHGGLPPTHG